MWKENEDGRKGNVTEKNKEQCKKNGYMMKAKYEFVKKWGKERNLIKKGTEFIKERKRADKMKARERKKK